AWVGALLVAVAAVKLWPHSDPAPAAHLAPPDPSADLAALLSQCRSYSSNEYGRPSWEKASAACDAVLLRDPINSKAIWLTKRIRGERESERKCERHRLYVEVYLG